MSLELPPWDSGQHSVGSRHESAFLEDAGTWTSCLPDRTLVKLSVSWALE